MQVPAVKAGGLGNVRPGARRIRERRRTSTRSTVLRAFYLHQCAKLNYLACRSFHLQHAHQVFLGEHPVFQCEGVIRQFVAIQLVGVLTDHCFRDARRERLWLRRGFE
jgi:hypothetical protein